jgi:hypothetical protein
MPLVEPRIGEEVGYQRFPKKKSESTIGSPERVIWSSIRHLCVRDVAVEVLIDTYNMHRKRDIRKVVQNLNVYITQAYEFYEAAKVADANTAPLIYYYSFLNLAKALCEIRIPDFHKSRYSYHHGLTWKPNTDYLVDLPTDYIRITTRGVFHILIEAIRGIPIQLRNPLPLKIIDLFDLCPEISTEFDKVLGRKRNYIILHNPCIYIDTSLRHTWIRIDVLKSELRRLRISKMQFASLLLPSMDYIFVEVKGADNDHYTFQSEPAIECDIAGNALGFNYIDPIISSMNLFIYMDRGEIYYILPVQHRMSMPLTQIGVLYLILFWLSSLVRYDPHSVLELQKSRSWILIDGFMNQSIIWLLELFEMQLYRQDKVLVSSR